MIQNSHLADFHLTVGAGRCSWVTLDCKPEWNPKSAVRPEAPSPRTPDQIGRPLGHLPAAGAITDRLIAAPHPRAVKTT